MERTCSGTCPHVHLRERLLSTCFEPGGLEGTGMPVSMGRLPVLKDVRSVRRSTQVPGSYG